MPFPSVEEILNVIKICESKIKLFNDLIANYNEVVEKAGFYEYANKLKAECEKLIPFYDIILKEFLRREALREKYLRSTGITELGWINCDKFLNITGRTLDLTIACNQNPQIAFYVIFEDIRSLIPCSYSAAHNKYVGMGIPMSMRVKIIGIRTFETYIEVSVAEGVAAELDNRQPDFKKYSLAELQTLIKS